MRVELSTDEPGLKKNNNLGGGPAGRPPGVGGPSGSSGAQGINMNLLPPGQDLPPGERATDTISKTLASIPPGKMEEVLVGMKQMVKDNPEGARAVFLQHPQLAYALFQGLLLMNAVDPSVIQVSEYFSLCSRSPSPISSNGSHRSVSNPFLLSNHQHHQHPCTPQTDPTSTTRRLLKTITVPPPAVSQGTAIPNPPMRPPEECRHLVLDHLYHQQYHHHLLKALPPAITVKGLSLIHI